MINGIERVKKLKQNLNELFKNVTIIIINIDQLIIVSSKI